MCKSLINVHFKFYVRKDCCRKVQNNVFGKSQDYNTTVSRQGKRQPTGSQLKEGLDKKYHFSNYALLRKVLHILSLLRTIIRFILVTCSRHRLFLHLNCLKSLRSLSSCPHVLTTLSLSLLTGVLFCKVLQGCFYSRKQQYIKDDFKYSQSITSNFTKLHRLVIFF